jgi:hypothetical protein
MADFDQSHLLPERLSRFPLKRSSPLLVEIFSLAADLSPLSSLHLLR